VGGLGGLAMKYDAGHSVGAVIAARDAKWEQLAAGEEDRQMEMGRLEQTFDGTGVEQASLDLFLPSSNRGYALLKRMGWREETGLGKRADGRREPVRMAEQYATLGLGKAGEYEEKAEVATESRKALTTEVIAAEDDDARQRREEQVAREEGIREKLKEETAAFYCEVCDKRYVKVKEFENHLSSYDHHHRKRFKEMRETEKARAKAKEKPRKEKKDPALLAAAAAAAAAGAEKRPPSAPSASASTDLSGSPPLPGELLPPPPPPTTGADGGADTGAGAGMAAPKAKFGGMSMGGGKAALGGRPGFKPGGPKGKPLSKATGFSMDET